MAFRVFRSSPKPWLWLLLPFCLLVAACFDIEQPVDERFLMSFLPDGGLRLKLSVQIRHLDESSSDSTLGKRLRQLEEDLLGGWDPWKKRFGDAEAAVENFYWEKEEGRLVYLERNLILDDPTQLSKVLADTSIQGTFRVRDGIAELSLYPGLATRATRRERREMDEILDVWSEEIALYIDATAELYRYLERYPERAVPVFAAIFEDDPEDVYGATTDEEDELLEAIGNAEVVGVLDVDSKRGESLEETSRRVFDPFPARFEVEIPRAAVDAEGFSGDGSRWTVPGLSLWSALEALEGVWLAPDPLLAWVEHAWAGNEAPFDVRGFAARERVAAVPYAGDVRDTLEKQLTPASVYRVAWPAAEEN